MREAGAIEQIRRYTAATAVPVLRATSMGTDVTDTGIESKR